MKSRLLAFVSLTLGLIILICSPVFAWRITDYHTQMDVQKDGSVIVTERITADFSNDPHHGLLREIPLTGKTKYGNKYRIRHHVIGITDQDGNKLRSRITYQGGRLKFKIGDPDKYVDGVETYIIRYRLQRAVHYFDKHDELYWNVVGNEWPVSIPNPSCTVTIPGNAPKDTIHTACYTGYYGSTSSDACQATPDNHTAAFKATRELNPGEAMTIVVGWPKGIVRQPGLPQRIWWFLTDNGFYFFPFIFALGLLVVWIKHGADPDTGRSEVVSFDPPENMSPAEIGTLIDEKVDIRDISASIIDLAVRGFITIESVKVQGFLSSKTDYTLRLNQDYDKTISNPELSEFDRTLIRALFGGMDFCVMSNLSGSFYKHLPFLKNDLYSSLMKRGYFAGRPDTVRTGYLGAGVILIIAGIAGTIMLLGAAEMPRFLGAAPGWGVALSVCGLLLAAVSNAMPRKTVKGKNALIAIRGFEEYLSRAEKNEIEHQERQGYFEKFLPYAMALGIADKWAHAFEGLQNEPPNWYVGYDRTFHPTIFVHDLHMAGRDWGGMMTAQPRSGGGGSDFFGGNSGFSDGFSGGGGGGGGGGAW